MATRTVTTNADSGTGSLRQAIADAAPGDTIVFDPTVFPTGQTTTITLASRILIAQNQIIDAGTEGIKRVELDGQGSMRCVAISYVSDSRISGVAFTRGNQTSTSANFAGGVFANHSTATFTNCSFNNCVVESTQSAADGGGFYCDTSTAEFTNCSFNNCSAIGTTVGRGGGAYFYKSTVTLTNCTFNNCSIVGMQRFGADMYFASGIQNTTINLNGNTFKDSVVLEYSNYAYTVNFAGYNGINNLTFRFTAPTITGSGFLALPSSADITLPNTITRTVYGAGVSTLSSYDDDITWSSVDSTKTVLLEKQNNDSWTTVNVGASSPATVSEEGTYRIWDGSTFLTTTVTFVPQTLVVTNTNDSGTGSLRAVLAAARDVDTVTFDNSLAGTTITLASKLEITHAVEIVGLVDADGKPDITISGANTYRILEGDYPMTLSNLIFANAGNAAISNEDANGSSFTNCEFINNSATDFYAGAVCLIGTAVSDSATFTDCVFSGNSSLKSTVNGFGGALSTSFINITASGCSFSNNVAQGGYGGAVFFGSSVFTLTLTNCSFTGNSIPTRNASIGDVDHGGAIYCTGSLVASGCTFTNNAVANQYDGDGGGAITFGYGGTLSNCTFSGNSAKIHGGAVEGLTAGSSPHFSNCSFSGNSTTYDTGSVGKDASQGGAIYSEDSVSCTSCTFTNNTTAGFGSSIAIENGDLNLTSCTFSGGSSTTFDVYLVNYSGNSWLSLLGDNNLPAGVATYSYSSYKTSITNAGYNGVGAYDEKSGSASTFSGSGFLALPPSTVVSLPGTLTQTEYGAGISNFSAGEDSLSWSSVDSTRTVLLEKQNGGSWDMIDVDATSPATVSQTGTYRIWDGANFLSTSIRFPIVVTNTNDSGAGSLRAAINSATADDTITFDPSLEGETIHLLSGLSSSSGTTIVGLTDDDGAPAITIDGTPDVEILTASGPVDVSNIHFENGNIVFYSSGGWDGSSFENCTFSGYASNVVELGNDGLTTETATFADCIFEDNTLADVFVYGDVEIILNSGNVLEDGVDASSASAITITNSGYNGIGAYTAPTAGTETVNGSGFLALPPFATITIPATITRSDYGAGVSDFKNADMTINWSSTDDTKSVLLEFYDDAIEEWTTVSDSATSPYSATDEGLYRIWDGKTFLTVNALEELYWLVKSWGVTSNGGGSDGATTHNWTVVNLPVNPNLGEEIE